MLVGRVSDTDVGFKLISDGPIGGYFACALTSALSLQPAYRHGEHDEVIRELV